MMSNKKIGEKIISLRESCNLSVEALAERSGLDVKQIKIIEANENIPSLAPLIKIARALGVRLGTFLDDYTELGPVVSRVGERSEAIRFAGKAEQKDGHLDFFSLAEQKAGRHMEPFLIDIEPTSEENKKLSSHEGEEFIYVLEGTLLIKHGNEEYRLQQGDSIYYDSIVNHLVLADNNQVAKILAVVYTPI
ncbi:MAG: helix-turn-helix transcriptional regulator [Paludibacteraceae bacterium]|nr:helix-turn-helix transcriptional regulator [Paludibacteraceae bacterium]MDI9537571.1 XRE family transcriptional regulator [Bacteroidota bacterium]HHT61102.1 helix-turn-helix domain-containing protein [Bacteroidales bacterium]MBP9039686.1 helix-turn-helix transcriptional regulator [Paludibacteraceae bacterium]HOA46330.1 XRE family transcriptional regulator [Paludibacteraceae bacterium]